jgi:hypothetical protein
MIVPVKPPGADTQVRFASVPLFENIDHFGFVLPKMP